MIYDNIRKKQEAQIENLNEKIVIALFGAPGKGKSSSINFLMTGDFESPLPNSLKSGKGVTQTPIRCEYIKTNNYHLSFIRAHNSLSVDCITTTEAKTKLSEMMGNHSFDEISVQIPLKYKPKDSQFPNNIQFLDLIGSPELDTDQISTNKESVGVTKNRQAVKSKDISAVFIMGDRSFCTADIIKHMWDINIFTDLKDRIPPKLIMFKIFQTWNMNEREIEESTVGFRTNQCLRSIQVSLLSAFDFEFKTEENARNERSTKTFELALHSKALVVPKLYKDSDSFCILVDKDLKISDQSQRDIKRIMDELINLIRRFSLIQTYDSIAIVLTEIIRKVNSKWSGLNRKTNDTSAKIIRILYSDHKYKEIVDSYHEKICEIGESTMDYILQENIMEALEINEISDLNDDEVIYIPFQKLEKDNQNLHSIREKIQSSLKLNSFRDEHEDFADMREPQLYNVEGSMRFPSSSPLQDVSISDLEFCFKNRWLYTDTKDAKASELLKTGRQHF